MNESKLLSPNGIVKASALCLLMSAFSVNAAFAVPVLDREVMVIQQGRTLTGTVVDNFGDPVIGANVIVKGTTIGNITDVNGTFTVENVPDDAVLQISYIGFKTLEVPVKGQTTFNITLQEDTENLQEVVVVGYGSSVKKDLTTAVTSVSSKDFLAGAVNDPMQMVDGKVAGVVVNSVAAADPNTSGSIQVRGASSLKAGNSPLIVIDGMPGGDLRNLAQSDIESITVLKDGSAAAIYGSRGANGVILVTTKQGKAGKTTITYDGYVEHDFVASKPDVLDAEAYLDKVTGAVDYGHRTNWYDELINKNNFGHNHNISLSGGSETTIFRMSANFKGKEGLDIASDRKEYGLRGNFKHTTLEGLLEVGGNFSYRIADEDYTDYASFKQAVQLNPTFSVDEMDDIAKGMKMSKRTLYKLFPSKTCLFRICLSDFTNGIRSRLKQSQMRMDSSCMQVLFATVNGYLTLLHSLGKTLLLDIAANEDYSASFKREEAFWLQQFIDVLTHCKICGYLLPGVDPDRFAADLQEVIYQSCLQGTPYVVQRALNHTLLRGLFEVDGIRYIDEHLKLDKFNVCV